MKKRLIKVISILFIAALTLLFGRLAENAQEGNKRDKISPVYVDRVIDGDSVVATVKGRREQLRLTGIDAPELGQRPWGRDAKKFLQGMVSDSGRQVLIEYDIQKRDQHGRILAYLWTKDRRLINEEMLRSGHAVVYTIPPNVMHADRLTAAQVTARENKLGIWGRAGLKQLPSDYRRNNPRKQG